eukprot:gnl/MRDRNA2_/MRDRNA2_77644_c0_seq2.p1 gnl/MRDRNA2_/MRDRNA2_77644_c0~~gnl/MRDRNA2_/MRDRNA2_77644_c0_seq2.p1  ORF type:complete len:216 (+),score=32.20 gnl/MRDRNA2_/MRDRNA2_77644_c0_seq2:126-773(+)
MLNMETMDASRQVSEHTKSGRSSEILGGERVMLNMHDGTYDKKTCAGKDVADLPGTSTTPGWGWKTRTNPRPFNDGCHYCKVEILKAERFDGQPPSAHLMCAQIAGMDLKTGDLLPEPKFSEAEQDEVPEELKNRLLNPKTLQEPGLNACALQKDTGDKLATCKDYDRANRLSNPLRCMDLAKRVCGGKSKCWGCSCAHVGDMDAKHKLSGTGSM